MEKKINIKLLSKKTGRRTSSSLRKSQNRLENHLELFFTRITLKRPTTICAKTVFRKYVNNRLRQVGFFPNDVNANDRLCKLFQDNFM